MQTYAQTFFAAPGRPIIPPPGSSFVDLRSSITSPQPKCLPLENLRAYVYAARIVRPKLAKGLPYVCQTRQERITPPDQFLLSIEPDSRFRLNEMAIMNREGMEKLIIRLMDKCIPSGPTMEVENPNTRIRTANFNIPAPGFLIYAKPLPPVDNVLTLAKYTLQVLETSERILNVVWPTESQGHTFIIPESSVIPAADAEICVPVYYTKVRERDLINLREPMVKMVVLVVPPWAFAGADLHDMISIPQPLPPMNTDGTRPPFNRVQKLWAQIYDCCTANNCPFFAVTTFANWIFGAFNPASGWTNVICNSNVAYSEFNPSLLEWITFWSASALKVPGTWSSADYPCTGVPQLRDASSNLRLPTADECPSSKFSDQEWINENLDDTTENAKTVRTEQYRENIWITYFN